MLAAGLAVWLTGSAWPGLLVAAIMAGLFIWSSFQIIRQATAELRHRQGTAESPEAAE